MKTLPDDLIQKIMLYNSSPTADIIKEYWRTLDAELNLFHDVEGFAVELARGDRASIHHESRAIQSRHGHE